MGDMGDDIGWTILKMIIVCCLVVAGITIVVIKFICN